jgi:hypothetical protein
VVAPGAAARFDQRHPSVRVSSEDGEGCQAPLKAAAEDGDVEVL